MKKITFLLSAILIGSASVSFGTNVGTPQQNPTQSTLKTATVTTANLNTASNSGVVKTPATVKAVKTNGNVVNRKAVPHQVVKKTVVAPRVRPTVHPATRPVIRKQSMANSKIVKASTTATVVK